VAHRFSFPSPADFTGALTKAKAKAQAAGGQVVGNHETGTFQGPTPFGPLAGGYRVEGGTVTVTVDKQPMLLPNSMIEGQIKSLFA